MGPCQGITVIDLSRYLPGRFCTMMLADLGADVITVEPPRQPAAKIRPIGRDTGARYLALNKNKRSMTLDLGSEDGRRIFYRLVEQRGDVVIEGSRPGVAERLRIDWPTIKKINSRAVYVSISNFGQDGPLRNTPGHDLNSLGIASLLSFQDGSPMPPRILLSDTIAALTGAIGVLSALLEVQRSGKGQYVDISILDALVNVLNVRATRHLLAQREGGENDDFTSLTFPFYNVYRTKDNRYITLAAVEPQFWEKLCTLLGRPDFAPYQFDKGGKRNEIFAHFRKRFSEKSLDEWLATFAGSDIPCGPVNSLKEVFNDPQVIHRRMVVEVSHPVLGMVKQLGNPIKFSETPCKSPAAPPLYGKHTEEILTGIGYSRESIEEFRKKAVIE